MKELIQKVLAKLEADGAKATPGELATLLDHMAASLEAGHQPHGGPAELMGWILDIPGAAAHAAEWVKGLREPSLDRVVALLESRSEFYRQVHETALARAAGGSQ